MSFSTMKKIQSVTVTGATAANIEFTSIPGTFDDLLVFISARGTNNIGTTGLNLQYNSSTSNYTYRRVDGSGSSVDTSTASTSSIAILQGANATTNTFGNYYIYIPNYASSIQKSATSDSVNETNGTTEYMSLYAHFWNDTSPITSLKLVPTSGSLVQHSSATLYGIRKS